MLSNAGKAVQPALTATAKGDSMDSPIKAHASLAKRSAISCHNAYKKKILKNSYINDVKHDISAQRCLIAFNNF